MSTPQVAREIGFGWRARSLASEHVSDLLLPEDPVLFLDAASPRLCVGLQTAADTEPIWSETNDEAGVGLSRETAALLQTCGLTIDDLRTLVWCEGPGSLLGIRLAAMMVRTWMALPRTQPLRVFGYQSLALVAADLLSSGTRGPFQVCSDARRETWNVLSVSGDGAIGEIRRAAAPDLPAGGETLFYPEEFPHWQPLPASAQGAPYRPQRVVELAARFPLLQETAAPDAFMTEMPVYKTWTPNPSA